jgi:hypothetical protein
MNYITCITGALDAIGPGTSPFRLSTSSSFGGGALSAFGLLARDPRPRQPGGGQIIDCAERRAASLMAMFYG